jgi:CheY-like chemotaxis protein
MRSKIDEKATPVPHILVVDDQPHVRAAMATALRANAFDVTGAEDAAAAIKVFEATRFDLAVVDIYMPSTDGIKLIKALRDRAPQLPIIAVSGVRLNHSEKTALAFLPQNRVSAKAVSRRRSLVRGARGAHCHSVKIGTDDGKDPDHR